MSSTAQYTCMIGKPQALTCYICSSSRTQVTRHSKGTVSREKLLNWDCGGKAKYQGCVESDFFCSRCPFNLLSILIKRWHPSKYCKIAFMLDHGSGVHISLRHWVVRKFAIHEHLYFACSVFGSPSLTDCHANIKFRILQLQKSLKLGRTVLYSRSFFEL